MGEFEFIRDTDDSYIVRDAESTLLGRIVRWYDWSPPFDLTNGRRWFRAIPVNSEQPLGDFRTAQGAARALQRHTEADRGE